MAVSDGSRTIAPSAIVGDATLYHADCRDVLRGLPDNSIDSVVTDPPYALVSIVKRFGKPGSAPVKVADVNASNDLKAAYARASAGFMGKTWDTGEVAFSDEFWAEVLRVLKPGGHVVAFSGTRTYHRMAVAIEDAGFEIRDQCKWMHEDDNERDAFLASLNDEQRAQFVKLFEEHGAGQLSWAYGSGFPKSHNQHGEWEGWGTALKPAWEPIALARKPLAVPVEASEFETQDADRPERPIRWRAATVAENLAKWGVGAINVDGCRVGTEGGGTHCNNRDTAGKCMGHKNAGQSTSGETFHGPDSQGGRWPANIVHDGSDEVLAGFPATTSGTFSRKRNEPKTKGVFGSFALQDEAGHVGDSGSAARFFYTAKASRKDRDEGLEGVEGRADAPHRRTNIEETADNPYLRGVTVRKNTHPTVKPTALMQWLCRLVTPPGGVILDPFMGSGSTGKAALLEGFKFIGCEREDEYMPIAQQRIAAALRPVAAKAQPAANDNLPLFAAPAQAGAAGRAA